MTVSSLEKVLAYVGSTGSTAISFILPGLFYYKISSPDSPLHQRLLKEEDDWDYEPTSNGDAEALAGSGEIDDETALASSTSGLLRTMSNSGVSLLRRTRTFRRTLLRRLSLALALYGMAVMVTCLVTNTVFLAR